MDHTLSLIQLAHQGDKEARDTLIKENMGMVYAVARRFLGREIAAALQADREELVLAMESGAEVESLQQTIFQGDGSSICLEDKLESGRDQQEEMMNRLLLEEMLSQLPAKERTLLYQRFFQERTQTEIARELGLSQVQVSRMEKRILKELRKKL